MDSYQEMLDRLFERPTTVLGMINKLNFLKERIYKTPFKSNAFAVLDYEIKETRKRLNKTN